MASSTSGLLQPSKTIKTKMKFYIELKAYNGYWNIEKYDEFCNTIKVIHSFSNEMSARMNYTEMVRKIIKNDNFELLGYDKCQIPIIFKAVIEGKEIKIEN